MLLYFILKMKLIPGKAIIFVNSIERCYRVKLFLEQFTLNTCVLNAELPQNTRYHIVQEFNRGVYDYIVATDDANRIQNRTAVTPTGVAAAGELDGLPASAQPGTDVDVDASSSSSTYVLLPMAEAQPPPRKPTPRSQHPSPRPGRHRLPLTGRLLQRASASARAGQATPSLASLAASTFRTWPSCSTLTFR